MDKSWTPTVADCCYSGAEGLLKDEISGLISAGPAKWSWSCIYSRASNRVSSGIIFVACSWASAPSDQQMASSLRRFG